MAHNHSVYDSDPHFTIDPITRIITNESRKTILMQYDHNSERFSFEIPRLVEGHDLTLCNKVEVHYVNIDSGRQGSTAGVYEITDLKVDPDNEDRVLFTWLVSQNATLYAGALNFLIVFACVEEDVVVYRWNTDINDSVSISMGMNNNDAIEEEYADILAQWKNELFGVIASSSYIQIGPVEPETYPYVWLDTSENLDTTEKNVGYWTVKSSDGVKQRIYPMVKVSSIDGLDARLKKIEDTHKKDIEDLNNSYTKLYNEEKQARTDGDNGLSVRIDGLEKILTGSVAAIAHSLTVKGVSVPANMSIQDVAALIDSITMDVPTELREVLVTTPPTQTEYYDGEVFNGEGMVVSANFGDGVIVPVEFYTVSPAIMTKDVTEIEVTLTVNGVTKTTTYPIKVVSILASTIPAGTTITVAESDTENASYTIADTDYYGNLLLVRNECLDNTIRYLKSAATTAARTKYDGSNLDTYLNDTFYSGLPDKTKNVIQSVDIPVRSNASNSAEGAYLNRKVFTLSSSEWGLRDPGMCGEATELTDSEFRKLGLRYWTRQVIGGMTNYAYAISDNDTNNNLLCTSTAYVRPAFCISKSQIIIEVDGVYTFI